MKKILLIDDDASETVLLSSALPSQDYAIEAAKDGEEGLAKVKTSHPDLILIDLLLPNMNGFEVLDRLKADPETKAIPVVILSILDDEKDLETALSKGAIQYIPKSEEPQKIGEIIRQILGTNTE